MLLFVSINQKLTQPLNSLIYTLSLFIHPSIHPSSFSGHRYNGCKTKSLFFLVGTKGWVNGTQEEGSRKLSRGRKHGSDVNFVWIVCHTNHFNLHSTVKGRRCQLRWLFITIIWVSSQNAPNCTCNSSVNFSCKLGEDEEKFAMFFHCHVIL